MNASVGNKTYINEPSTMDAMMNDGSCAIYDGNVKCEESDIKGVGLFLFDSLNEEDAPCVDVGDVGYVYAHGTGCMWYRADLHGVVFVGNFKDGKPHDAYGYIFVPDRDDTLLVDGKFKMLRVSWIGDHFVLYGDISSKFLEVVSKAVGVDVIAAAPLKNEERIIFRGAICNAEGARRSTRARKSPGVFVSHKKF